ncbi:ADM_collapsed_G0035150.mRNA.1.CDS.1 [Saccharomyces cerevisiae]|nr:ADM_collapsed_G0035150.mRNA.1.CDS.1 [Saccharomyces cerevisiae]CAI7406960.1 CBM_collapsed_G0036660.mRNA.1.CDS.1 [Saccharomyces cerevisiae]
MSKPGRTILASKVAETFNTEIINNVEEYKKTHNGQGPLLVGFLANNDPAAKMYATWTQKTSESMGFRYDLRVIEDKDFLEEAIIQANGDDSVNDVEGLNHVYYQNLYHNVRYLDKENRLKSILPCTPLAIVKILEFLKIYNNLLPEGNRLYGKKCIVINRSEIVGRPLAALLANDGATVYSVDVNNIQKFTRGESLKLNKHHVEDLGEYSEDLLKKCSLDSDVVITGVPSENYKFPTEYIKEGAVCINFACTKNFSDDVKEKASLYVPMTGKVTIAMLLRNMLRLVRNVELSKEK